jgi:hypothetical protein
VDVVVYMFRSAVPHAETLRKINQAEKACNEIVMDILQNLHAEMTRDHNLGKRTTTANIPFSFNIPEMTNAEAQLYIWGNVVDTLTKKGYVVGIDYNRDVCIIQCSWVSKKEESYRKLYKSILDSHRCELIKKPQKG